MNVRFLSFHSLGWAFEVVALLAGLIGTDALAAQTIVLNTSSLAYCLPLGISVAASTRIGNCLGSKLPKLAMISARVAMLLALVIATFNSLTLIIIKENWGFFWTDDKKVVEIVSQILPLAALFQFSDGICAIGGGILRGCGKQKIGAIINLCGYYILALPLGGFLAFQIALGLTGLWLGLTSGLFAVSIVFMLIIYRIQWEREAEKAEALANHHPSHHS